MTTFEKLKAEIKIRYVIGFLIGTTLATIWVLSYFVIFPKENELTIAEIRSVFAMAFGAFINHVMKTPENEKRINQ